MVGSGVDFKDISLMDRNWGRFLTSIALLVFFKITAVCFVVTAYLLWVANYNQLLAIVVSVIGLIYVYTALLMLPELLASILMCLGLSKIAQSLLGFALKWNKFFFDFGMSMNSTTKGMLAECLIAQDKLPEAKELLEECFQGYSQSKIRIFNGVRESLKAYVQILKESNANQHVQAVEELLNSTKMAFLVPAIVLIMPSVVYSSYCYYALDCVTKIFAYDDDREDPRIDWALDTYMAAVGPHFSANFMSAELNDLILVKKYTRAHWFAGKIRSKLAKSGPVVLPTIMDTYLAEADVCEQNNDLAGASSVLKKAIDLAVNSKENLLVYNLGLSACQRENEVLSKLPRGEAKKLAMIENNLQLIDLIAKYRARWIELWKKDPQQVRSIMGITDFNPNIDLLITRDYLADIYVYDKDYRKGKALLVSNLKMLSEPKTMEVPGTRMVVKSPDTISNWEKQTAGKLSYVLRRLQEIDAARELERKYNLSPQAPSDDSP